LNLAINTHLLTAHSFPQVTKRSCRRSIATFWQFAFTEFKKVSEMLFY
jgi:hypothetical protein